MRTYIAIDLKSFYASVECIERGLDPMTTNLVVADASRTEKTICLAVSPSLKAHGISGRARLFEVVQTLKNVNEERKKKTKKGCFEGKSYSDIELKNNPNLEISYITAPPRMAHYMKYSASIYGIYLKYIAKEDIHVYSIDEVFLDVTQYLSLYQCTGKELAIRIMEDIKKTTGITATAGIGTNLYLAKVALDITAKRVKDHIGYLDEALYQKTLWKHRPLTDFWRIGSGISKRLESCGIYTMGDIARCSINNEALLYKLFGVNAELLIDHAWGWEPCTLADIKAYKPSTNCLSSGQVLHCPYDFNKAKIVLKEMLEALSLDLVEKKLVTDQIVLTVGYDIENLTDAKRKEAYNGEIKTDFYGRQIPKHARGTANLGRKTASTRLMTDAVVKAYEENVDKNLLIRRINITANRVVPEETLSQTPAPYQLSLFEDYEETEKQKAKEDAELEKERRIQETLIGIKNKFGKNAILKGLNLQEGATAKDRNEQIGGHKA